MFHIGLKVNIFFTKVAEETKMTNRDSLRDWNFFFIDRCKKDIFKVPEKRELIKLNN
jgi:hypothetical protein